MIELEFLGPANDGEALVFTDQDGERYRVVATPELRAEVSRTLLRAAPKTHTGPTAGPGFIQSLLRQGLTPGEVAEQTNSDVDRVLRYYPPVEAEIARAVQIAQQSRVGNELDSPVMGELVIDRLAARGVDPESVQWTASREPGADWVTCLRFPENGELHSARWTVPDGKGRAVALDPVARELTETVELLSPVDSLFAPAPLFPRGSSQRQPREAASVDLPVTPKLSEDDQRTSDRLRQEDLVERLNRLRGKHDAIIEEMSEAPEDDRPISVIPSPEQSNQAPEPSGDDPEAAKEERDTAPILAPSTGPADGPDSAEINVQVVEAPQEETLFDEAPPELEAPSEPQSSVSQEETPEPEPTTSSQSIRKQRRTPVPSWDEIIFGKQPDQ